MTSQLSRLSQQSLNSEALQKVAQSLNASRLHRLIDEIDEDTMKAIWNGFGLYVSRQMRMGRGVSLNRFGTFSFGPSEFSNEGMTVQRKQPRQPVFLVSPELVKGGRLKQSVFCTETNNLRPFIAIANGILPVTPLNYTELCQMLGQPSDKCKAAIYRMITTLSQKIIQDGRADLELPGVGYLLVKNGLCGFQFFSSFIEATKNGPSLTLEEKRERGDMTLNSKNLSLLEAKSMDGRNNNSNPHSDVEIDSSVNQYLESSLGIKVHKPGSSQLARSDYFNSFQKKNASLRLKPSFSFTQKSFHSSIHRSFTSKPQKSISQSIIQLWLIQNQLTPSESFMKLHKSLELKEQTDKYEMNIDQFRIAAANNNLKLAPEMIEEVFGLLDLQHKGVITIQDWTRLFSIQEVESKEKKALEQLRQQLNRKGIEKAADVIKELFGYSSKDSEDSKLLGLEQISQYLKKLDSSLTMEQAQSMSKEILFQLQEEQIKRQTLAAFLAPKESEGKEWFKKLMLKLNAIFSASSWDGLDQLKEAFASYDTANEGLLDVASFKILLLKSNLNLDITEINHIIDFLDRDSHDRIDYFKFLQNVKDTSKRYQAQRSKVYDEIDFLERIQRHIRVNAESAAGFLQMLRNTLKQNNEASNIFNVTPKILAAYLKKTLFEDEDISLLERLSEKVDMNHDGIIDSLDLQYYLKNTKFTQQSAALSEVNPSERIQYLPLDSYGRSKRQSIERYSNQSLNKQRSNSQSKFIYSFNGSSEFERNKSVGSNTTQQQSIAFPVIPLSDEKLNQVLRDLRKKIDSKGISFKHFCELLDGEKTGLISASSFLKNIDNVTKNKMKFSSQSFQILSAVQSILIQQEHSKYFEQFIHLSEATKEGLFANIDKLHIGMIDQKRLLEILEKSVLSTGSEEVSEDNWQWQDDVLQRIYAWYANKGFESEAEAFRVMDYQFKGSVEHSDLKRFVKEVLKISESDITDARINRLFKIFDFYKSGKFTFLDFSKFLQQQRNIRKLLGFNPSTRSNSGEKTTSLKEEAILTLDWKSSVQQQLGLALSRLFATTSEGFETISDSKGKITFGVFEKWLDKTNALIGFDLTKTLLQEFFAFLDPHKKGFLSEVDWNQAFENIQWKKQMAEQIRSLLLLHFNENPQPTREAFKFFLKQEKTSNQQEKISMQGFISSLNYLYPRRFNQNDLKEIWKSEIHTSNSEQELDFDSFKRFLSKLGNEDHTIQSSIEAINRLKRDILFYPQKHSSRNSSDTQLNRARLIGNKLNSSSAVITKKEQPSSSYSSLSPFRTYAPISITGKKAYSPSRNIKLEEIKLKNILQGGQFFSDNTASKFHHHPNAKSFHEILSKTNKVDLQHQYSFHEKSKSGITSLFRDYSALVKSSNNSSGLDLSAINNQRVYESSRQATEYGEQILKKLRRISRSAKEIETVFRKYDELGVGSLTNLQLRNAFQELHLGLDNRELGFFLNLCDQDGRLQISKLVNLLEKQAPEDLMIQQRGKIRLQELARDITNKMLSPEDAFRRYCKPGAEKMTFEIFETLYRDLSSNKQNDTCSISVIKDIFSYFDLNQVGEISLNEWKNVLLEAKSKGNLSQILKEKQPLTKIYSKYMALLVKDSANQSDFCNSLKEKRARHAERKKISLISGQNNSSYIQLGEVARIQNKNKIKQIDGEELTRIVAKNRKYFLKLFQQISATREMVSFDQAKEMFAIFLTSNNFCISESEMSQWLELFTKSGDINYRQLLEISKSRLIE